MQELSRNVTRKFWTNFTTRTWKKTTKEIMSLDMQMQGKSAGHRANARLPPEVNRALYVRNLPFKITSEEMYDIFGKVSLKELNKEQILSLCSMEQFVRYGLEIQQKPEEQHL
jgi:RNA recognition motif-containing protein